jgi:ElaB/YqjD/DUF883 family membrane-anchored ribosome-binding protein
VSGIVEPVTAPTEGHADTKTTHPAFAQITVQRSHGGARTLYASDFQHHASLTIRIANSELHRGLAHDWHHSREEYIEVELSEAQWATFVSSVGMGGGVACTLRQRNGEVIPGLPAPQSRADQFADELTDDINRILKRCDGLMATAKNKAQANDIAMLKQDLEKNLPFVAASFSQHMEKTVESAKSEVHGYMTGAIQRAGLDALGVTPPLKIAKRSEQ